MSASSQPGLHDVVGILLDNDWQALRLTDLFALMRTCTSLRDSTYKCEHWETMYRKYTAQCIDGTTVPEAFTFTHLVRTTWNKEPGLLPAMCPPSAVAVPGRMQMNVVLRIQQDLSLIHI